MTNERSYLSCDRISHSYTTRGGAIAALRDVQFEASKDEFLAIVGPSGCGKTTLLKIIAGLIEPTDGEVKFRHAPPNDRPRAALVFQDHALLPWLTVCRNVELGLEKLNLPRGERRRRAADLLGRVGLDGFEDAYPYELSVGMRQRVALARAFVSGAPVLLLDEPFAAIDAQTRQILRQDLFQLWRQERKLILYVTHDIEEAVLSGDRVLILSGRPGQVVRTVSISEPRPNGRFRDPSPQTRNLAEEIWSLLEGDIQRALQPGLRQGRSLP